MGWATPDTIWPSWINNHDHGAEGHTYASLRLPTGWLEPDRPARRYLSRLQITGRLDHGAELRVFLSYDGGPWQRAGTFRRTRAGAEVFPVFPRRCGRLRLRLEGQGGMELESMSWLTEAGSDV